MHDFVEIIHLLVCSTLSFVAFFLAVQRATGLARQLFGLSSVTGLILYICLDQRTPDLLHLRRIIIPFATGMLLHAISLIFVERRNLHLEITTPVVQQIRLVFRTWTNFASYP